MLGRRKILIALGVCVGLLALVVALLHTSAVQKPILDRMTAAIAERTGFSVAFDDARLRLWPARLVVNGLEVSVDDVVPVRIARLEARWSWVALVAAPRRIDEVIVDGLDVDATKPVTLPESDPDQDSAADPWRAIEIGRFEIRGDGGVGALVATTAALNGLSVRASLEDGRAAVEASATSLILTRSERRLDLGGASLAATASEAGIVVESFDLSGGDVELEAHGELVLAGSQGRAELHIAAGAAEVLGWWDPNLASGLQPAGRLDLEAAVSLAENGAIEAETVHRGERLMVAGYEVDALEVGFSDETVSVRVAGDPWGAADVAVDGAGLATVAADLTAAPVERVLAVAWPESASLLEGPTTLTGTLDGTVSYPFDLERLTGEVELVAEAANGRAELIAAGARDRWTVSGLRVDFFGAGIHGTGEIGPGSGLSGEIELDIPDPSVTSTHLARWFPELEAFAVGGGGISGRVRTAGRIDEPRLEAELRWVSPSVGGLDLEAATVRASGKLDDLEFAGRVATESGFAVVEGSADVEAMAAGGTWEAEADNVIRAAVEVAGPSAALDGLAGSVRGSGSFELTGADWRVDGAAEAFDVSLDGWTVDDADVVFRAEPARLELGKLRATFLGGDVTGSGTVALAGPDNPVDLDVEWAGLELARVPMELDLPDPGLSSGTLELRGTANRPTGRLDAVWRPALEGSRLPSMTVVAGLENGVLSVATEQVKLGDSVLSAKAEVPLGAFSLPDSVWPDAPDGAARLTVTGRGLTSEGLLALLGRERQPLHAAGDLDLEASWRPDRPGETRALVELGGFELRHPGGVVAAEEPVVIGVDGPRVSLTPVTLRGPQTSVTIGGVANLDGGELDGSVAGVLAPGISRLVPYPMQIHEPITVDAAVTGTIARPRAEIAVSHPGGALVFRDPPLMIRDLVFEAELDDGALWINDGRATVNQGRMEIGGGWDRESEQGIVAEIEDVVVFLDGILSQWSGALAVEPRSGEIAKVVGELNLVAGLWDENVDLGGALFGAEDLDPESDDPLNGISLDLDVRGRGAIRVDNNLGRFNARWNVIRVGGTAARPRLRGEVDIDPGGTFTLAGQKVTVRRGGLLFTGDPDLDPIVEIVPESSLGLFGSEEGGIDTTAVAAQGLVEGLTGALGFANETVQPAEISVEVEEDTSQQVMLGQRLGHHVALFFATNTTDVQDRTSMLQLWNIPGLKGLALQWFEKTLEEETGANLIQRFRWGGGSSFEDRPVIRKLELQGDWPLNKRRLKRTTGLRRGQPYDAFLPFVARVRMERALAGAGYQEARVRAVTEQSDRSWILRFDCEPGERREVRFAGDEPPRHVRKEVTALYMHPPLETVAFRNMKAALDRHFAAEGFPDASIDVTRLGDAVEIEVARSGRIILDGPVLDGVPPELAERVIARLGQPSELARMAADEQRAARSIERVLAKEGYHHAEVISVATVAVAADAAEVRAVVEPGPRSRVAELIVAGDDVLGLASADGFSLREGSLLDSQTVDLAASRLRAGYDAAGYSEAAVRGSAEEIAAGEWRVTVLVEPGTRRVFEGVEITGNRHTSEKAFTSGLTLRNGEILTNPDLDATAVRIANFAPVERVDVRTIPEGSDGAKVSIEVLEQQRWTAEVGGGWSSDRGFQARMGLRDDNLFGRGVSLNLRGRWDETEWLGFLIASMPPLPGKRLSFSSTIGFSRGEPPDGSSDVLEDRSFWSIEASRWLGRGEVASGSAGGRITGYYRLSRTHTYDKEPPDPDDFFAFPIDITFDIGLLGARYVKDGFDNPFDPTSGYEFFLDVGFSHETLASDLDYWTATASATTATDFFGGSTLIQGLRTGVSRPLHGGELVPSIKLYAGGQGSIRGFDRNSVGPVTYAGGETWTPDGGGAFVVLNGELRVPVWQDLRAAVFADVGQVWASWSEADLDLAVGAGLGIRWATPIGPLWADVAWPVRIPVNQLPEDYFGPELERGITSTKPKFYVGIGRTF